jgi:hypothetical protein
MLIKDSFEIDVVEALNGAIADKMFKEALAMPCDCIDRTYILIFMDIQMLVMGGEEIFLVDYRSNKKDKRSEGMISKYNS